MNKKSTANSKSQRPILDNIIKEIGKLLQKYRRQARLSQSEIAKELGLKESLGFKYISLLETGRIKNPSLLTVLNYLKVCRVSWSDFFQTLSAIDIKLERENIFRQVEMPHEVRPHLRKKIELDTAGYLLNITYPKAPLTNIDISKIQERVQKKVKKLLLDLQTEDVKIQSYLNFMHALIDNYYSEKHRLVFEKYAQDNSLRAGVVQKIRNLVYQAFHQAEKQLLKPKPHKSKKLQTMTKEFIHYRIKIEPIEQAVQQLLGTLKTPIVYNQAYKDYARACLKTLKKYHLKDPLVLKQHLNEIKNWWLMNKLNSEVLDKVLEVTQKAYFNQINKATKNT